MTHFLVVVVQWRQRNVQKSVMHVQNCCFRYKSLLLFCPSRRRRRRRIISSLKDGDVVWRQFVCFLFLNKLDFQLMSTWQFDCISLRVYVIFLCQLSCLVPVTDFLIGDRCLTYNSSNFDRISLPNIKQNGARVTPVVIQWVDLFAVETVWSSCHQSLFFSNLGYLDRFQQSAVLTFYLPLHLEPQRGNCSALYPAFHKEDLKRTEGQCPFWVCGNSIPSVYWVQAVYELCVCTWP